MDLEGLFRVGAREVCAAKQSLDFGRATEVTPALDVEADLPIDGVGSRVQAKGVSKPSGLTVDPTDKLEIAGFFLLQPLLARQQQCAIECRECQRRLSHPLISGAQLPQSVLLASRVAYGARQGSSASQHRDCGAGISYLDVEHSEICQRAPLNECVIQRNARAVRFIESQPCLTEIAELGMDQSNIVGGFSERDLVARRASYLNRFLIKRNRIFEPSLIPREKTQRVI